MNSSDRRRQRRAAQRVKNKASSQPPRTQAPTQDRLPTRSPAQPRRRAALVRSVLFLVGFLGLISALLTILSVSPWPVSPTIHPAFLDYTSSQEGILFTAKNDSWIFPVYDFAPTCDIIRLETVGNNIFTNSVVRSGRHGTVSPQSSSQFSCGFRAAEGEVLNAEIMFEANYETRFLWLKLARTIKSDIFTWDGHRWIEGRPI